MFLLVLAELPRLICSLQIQLTVRQSAAATPFQDDIHF